MAVKVVMPTFGMTEGEATVIKWLKEVGDPVKADEIILTVETEKAVLEVPAPTDGILLKIVAKEGQSVVLTGLIGWIGQPDEVISDDRPELSPAPTAVSEEQYLVQNTDGAKSDGWVRASPLARRIARNENIDLANVTGTGPGGRVMKADVRQAIKAITPAKKEEPFSQVSIAPSAIQPASKIRQLTAERMTESFRTAPHFYLQIEINAAKLVNLRNELLSDIEEITGARLTFTDLLVYALSNLLPRYPLLNATWEAEGVRTYSEINLGIAVATAQGLVVPVIHQAEALSLGSIVQNRNDLTIRAKANKLTLQDMIDCTFTVTNLGMYGIDNFIPIINPPQSAILAVGAIKEKPVGIDGQIELCPTMNLTLAVDHRVADGAVGAEFLGAFKALLEAPLKMLVNAKR